MSVPCGQKLVMVYVKNKNRKKTLLMGCSPSHRVCNQAREGA